MSNSNNNENDRNIIVIKPQHISKYPYFQAMSHFYNIPMGKNIVLERNSSGFNDREFNALKSIIENDMTSNYEMAMFLRNYLQLHESEPNIYNPMVTMPKPIERKKGYYIRIPGKKARQLTRKVTAKYNNNNWNLYEPTNKELLKAVEMANRESERENVEALVEAVLGPNRVNVVVAETEKAKSMRSKYPKSGKRPSKTSRTSSKHLANKRLRQTLRKLNRHNKGLKVENNV
jgi:hypothetical protein